MTWKKQPLTSQAANQLHTAGHIDINDLRTIATWSNQHAVIALNSDHKHWHYWFWDTETNVWTNQGSFTTATAAKKAAERYEDSLTAARREEALEARAGEKNPAQVVVARWAVEPYLHEGNKDKALRVTCSSVYTTGVISEIFKRLGLSVETEPVAV